ncbi:hypothetical protein GQ53DRAFT_835900 [Thozetella sp. PMI_491]|nr:hypothetical protein GQ53DRAFT_835900 [Thozetella sp. PMI_491]
MSSSSTPSLESVNSQRLSTGEVAGIAIVCAAVGSVVGWTVSLLFYRWRHHFRKDGDTSDEEIIERKGPLSPVLSSTRASSEAAQFLLEPTPDKELAAQVTEIGRLIQEHAETFYHLEQIQPKLGTLVQGLGNMGVSRRSDMTSGELISLVLNPYTRHAALQHVISIVVFKTVDFSARSRLSILPAPVAAFLRAIPPDGSNQGSPEVNELALTQWRILSASLLHPNRGKKTALAPVESAIASQAMAIVSVMNTFLYPFIDVEPNAEDKHRQAKDLQAILLKTARLGYAIFSHPCEWYFSNTADASRPTPGLLVVCPGLEKLSSKDGKTTAKPIQVVQPAVKKI